MRQRSGRYPRLAVDATGAHDRVARRWCGAGGNRPRRRPRRRPVRCAGAVAQAARPARSGQGHLRPGDRARPRRGLPGRHRGAARGAGRLRQGRLRPDRLPGDRRARRRRLGGDTRGRRRQGRRPSAGVGRRRQERSRPRQRRRPATGHRRGRDVGGRALGEGERRADVQTGLRLSSLGRVRRPRP